VVSNSVNESVAKEYGCFLQVGNDAIIDEETWWE